MADTEGAGKKTTVARTVKDKWRSKHWFKVRAPGLFQHVEIGETLASDPEQVVGRTLEKTLPELSGGADVGKAHIKLRFRIDRVAGDGVAEARFIGHVLTTDYVRRLARRKRSKIDTSLVVTTKDGVQLVLKPVAVGEQRLQTRLRAGLRHRLRELLLEEAKQRTAAEFVREMLQGELGKILAHGLKTLYPLKKIEIRTSEVRGMIAEEVEAAPPAGPETGPEPPEMIPPEPADGGAVPSG
ncbi:MAG TPA: 30S ribosomal protein S3ae [Thermoplasmata archaeon]|nr:30S ribosomal protein S3ae [Thermoplasmata archaeon]